MNENAQQLELSAQSTYWVQIPNVLVIKCRAKDSGTMGCIAISTCSNVLSLSSSWEHVIDVTINMVSPFVGLRTQAITADWHQ
jgi:hypothetical protein